MTLLEVVGGLEECDSDLTIYAVKPWRPESEALLIEQPEDGNTSQTFKTNTGNDASYFLEVFIAKEFLAGWREGHSVPLKDDCERLIHYAIYDG